MPLTAPGEVVEAEPVADRKNRIEARLVSVIEPSPDRRDAPCPHYAECGGCQLQHIGYAAQAKVRRGFVIEAIERERLPFGGELEFVPSPFELGYRNRAQPAVAGGKLGCLKRRSHEIIEIEDCPLCLPDVLTAIASLKEYLRTTGDLAAPQGRVFVMCGENGKVAAEPSPDHNWPEEVRWTLSGVTFWCRPDVFFQANAHLLDALQGIVCDGQSGGAALDLFGGVGFFSIPLARSFRSVTVIEEDRAAVALGKRNARDARADNVRFIPSRVEDLDPEAIESQPDLIIVDPPRAGLSNKAFDLFAALSPERAVYVSCDPSSMARDLKKMARAGWTLRRLVVLDMFPQTFHVETVAFLSRFKIPV
ncbi:MAG: class I SAM-dependent RNA methyltransferase [Deltaproteobacteria bacterium]|nr:class I SAM-dependent RNA methyltransferase [Deltaproteobacteria bacterium]